MREYTIKLNFAIETPHGDYEKITEFAEKLSEAIMNDDDLISSGDIEIVEVTVDEVEDNNYDCDDYLDDEDEDGDEL